MSDTNQRLPIYRVSIHFNSGSVLEFETTWFSYYPEYREFEYERRNGGPVFVDMKSVVAINVIDSGNHVDEIDKQQIVRIP